jgi:hypothetical protein
MQIWQHEIVAFRPVKQLLKSLFFRNRFRKKALLSVRIEPHACILPTTKLIATAV